ncbi:MAG: flippase-like domain-containing protein [Oscillospiraceae bacterium]|jgi:uncharacterized protein (TIRG00374 family)|nr:flippase-like domain-containing protein [Oscillospiraceae bacterium]
MKNKNLSLRTMYNISIMALVVGIFSYLAFSEGGLFDLFRNSKSFNKKWLFLAVVLHLLNMLVDIFNTYVFANNVKKISFNNSTKVSLVGQFFSAITPGAYGGQPMQVVILSNYGIKSGIAVSILIQKFLVYQTVLTILSALAIIIRFDYFNNQLDKTIWFLTILGFLMQAIVILGILLFSFNKKLTNFLVSSVFKIFKSLHFIKNYDEKVEKTEKQLEAFYKGNIELFKNRSLVLKTYTLTTIQLLCMSVVPFYVCRAIYVSSVNLSLIDMMCAQIFIITASSLIPTPGSLGAAEGAMGVFLMPFFNDETIKPAILIVRLISYYLTIFISFPFSHLAKKRK